MNPTGNLTASVCSARNLRDEYSYVLITPARNEAQFLDRTIQSVIRQTLRPAKWVIVSDGSTDGTDELVSNYSAQYDWIELVSKPARKERHFAAKVDAFNTGYERVKDLEYDVIGNLDADVSFDDAQYFKFLTTKFAENPTLGVCGTSYLEGNVTYPSRFTSLKDVFGACQMFRRECFEAIGGYPRVESGGIDLIAFLSAQAKGWQTRTFTEKTCHHHRAVGSGQHAAVYTRLLKTGRKDYLLGCHPAWQIVRTAFLMKNKPYIVGGFLMLVGFLWAMLCRIDRTIPVELVKLRQDDQMERLKSILWRTLIPGFLTTQRSR
jgi:biofilm PGA synthesis N-glycosyltransferase PgaC